MNPSTFTDALKHYKDDDELIEEIIHRNPDECACLRSDTGRALMRIFINYARQTECYFGCQEQVDGFVEHIRQQMKPKKDILENLLKKLEVLNDTCEYCDPGYDVFDYFATTLVLCWT